MISIIIKQILK